MSTTVIPKDCLVCDACNDLLVDEDGNVVQPFAWTAWGLSCRRHKPVGEVIADFAEGEVVPKGHVLWAPIVITDWDGRDAAARPARPFRRAPERRRAFTTVNGLSLRAQEKHGDVNARSDRRAAR